VCASAVSDADDVSDEDLVRAEWVQLLAGDHRHQTINVLVGL
jgi:hypothetical protein